MRARYRYSRWDGTQDGFEVDAQSVLARLADELLYHGDLAGALRRLVREGFTDAGGRRVVGLGALLERLRRRREEVVRRYDPSGALGEVARRLEEILELERRGIDAFEAAAESSGDPRRAEVARAAAAERRLALALLPPELPRRVAELRRYEFTSSAAAESFDALLEELRAQAVRALLDRAAAGVAMDPEGRERLRRALDALNRMLEQRAAGEALDPDFAQFMALYGDLFPGSPSSLDELLEQLARRMAATSALLASMRPEERAELEGLLSGLLADLDLSWQLERLGTNLRAALPGAGWDRGLPFAGREPLELGEGAEVFEELGALGELEELLRGAADPGALAHVDLDRVRELLGADAAASLEVLSRLGRVLEASGFAERRGEGLELTPRGVRRLGERALEELFGRLDRERLGRHAAPRPGTGPDPDAGTKPWEPGDPFRVDIGATLRNAIRRSVASRAGRRGVRFPVRLELEDFAIERSESVVRSATVLLLDLSLSMPMRDSFLPAKKVALALHTLIAARYPQDFLGIVGFSELAREIRPAELPGVSWDYVYGTNLHHALLLARRMLASERGNRQIILVTDGEPTAHLQPDGEVFFRYPPARETVEVTLAEVLRATRDGVRINTFMLDASEHLRGFVETLTRINRGRAFFTSPDELGDYLLVDFVENRRERRLS